MAVLRVFTVSAAGDAVFGVKRDEQPSLDLADKMGGGKQTTTVTVRSTATVQPTVLPSAAPPAPAPAQQLTTINAGAPAPAAQTVTLPTTLSSTPPPAVVQPPAATTPPLIASSSTFPQQPFTPVLESAIGQAQATFSSGLNIPTSFPTPTNSSKNKIAEDVGIAVGGAALVAVLIIAIYMYSKHSNHQDKKAAAVVEKPPVVQQQQPPPQQQPNIVMPVPVRNSTGSWNSKIGLLRNGSEQNENMSMGMGMGYGGMQMGPGMGQNGMGPENMMPNMGPGMQMGPGMMGPGMMGPGNMGGQMGQGGMGPANMGMQMGMGSENMNMGPGNMQFGQGGMGMQGGMAMGGNMNMGREGMGAQPGFGMQQNTNFMNQNREMGNSGTMDGNTNNKDGPITSPADVSSPRTGVPITIFADQKTANMGLNNYQPQPQSENQNQNLPPNALPSQLQAGRYEQPEEMIRREFPNTNIPSYYQQPVDPGYRSPMSQPMQYGAAPDRPFRPEGQQGWDNKVGNGESGNGNGMAAPTGQKWM